MVRRLAIAIGVLLSAQTAAAAGPQVFIATLSGAQQVPAVSSSGTGTGTVVLNAAETQITVNMAFSGLTSAANASHIHGSAAAGANAGVLFDFAAATPAATAGAIPEQTFAITPAQVADLKAGLFYFNIHTANFGNGEIRGQIGLAAVQFNTTLSGAQQVPAVASQGTGTGTVALNAAEDRLFVNLSFSGLTSNAVAAHIHGAAAAGANAGVLFDFAAVVPAATSGSIPQQSFAISPAQVADLKAGLYYFNIHTTNFGNGEIRGQILSGPAMSLSRTALNFAAASNGAAFVRQTPSQAVRLTQSGSGTVGWTAAADVPWLTVSPASGTGAAVLTIATQFTPGLLSSQTGTISVTFSGAGNTAGPIGVTLTIVSSAATASPAFGVVDTPVQDGRVLDGSIAVTGWALDNIGVSRVELWRDLQPGETTPPFASSPADPRQGKVFIAVATFVDGARPDVEALNPNMPFAYRAGWGYLLLTWGLWDQGNGTYTLRAFAIDQEDNISALGSKTIVVSNNLAAKPFGSIDTPAIGADASGPNFGWGLTPKVNGAATCKIQPSGVQVSIDSGPLQPVVYGDNRTDIAGGFPGFSNSDAAGGHYFFDWSTLANGPHTIGWLITDDCNRVDGVGSRFFNITTGTSLTVAAIGERLPAAVPDSGAGITVARGYGELPQLVSADDAGSRTIEVRQGERIEVRLPRGFDTAYQLVAGQRRALPIGATWDAAAGLLSWQPAPGFLGRYRFVFTNGEERINVRVVVGR